MTSASGNPLSFPVQVSVASREESGVHCGQLSNSVQVLLLNFSLFQKGSRALCFEHLAYYSKVIGSIPGNTLYP